MSEIKKSKLEFSNNKNSNINVNSNNSINTVHTNSDNSKQNIEEVYINNNNLKDNNNNTNTNQTNKSNSNSTINTTNNNSNNNKTNTNATNSNTNINSNNTNKDGKNTANNNSNSKMNKNETNDNSSIYRNNQTNANGTNAGNRKSSTTSNRNQSTSSIQPSSTNNTPNSKTNTSTSTSVGVGGNYEISSVEVEQYINQLKALGFNDTDISRVITGQTTIEELFKEIDNDTDTSRKRQIMEAQYIKSFKEENKIDIDANNLNELDQLIKNQEQQISDLIQKKNNNDNNELDDIMFIMNELKTGKTLEEILATTTIWQYTDEDGNIRYGNRGEQINPGLNSNEITNDGGAIIDLSNRYKKLSLKELYKDSSLLNQLENVLTARTEQKTFLGEKVTEHRFIETNEQIQFFNEIEKKYQSESNKNKEEISKNLENQINELKNQKNQNEYIKEYIKSEVDYYIENINPYVTKKDFFSNNEFNNKSLNILEKYKNGVQNGTNGDNTLQVHITDKNELVDVLACMLNNQGGISDLTINTEYGPLELSSNDELLQHYKEWLPFVSQDELNIFNYIYNTEGTDEAYKYLERISDELDRRWLTDKTQKDQEYAKEHPFLASAGSIVLTPFEGMSAAAASINSYVTGEKIRRTDVYSSGDVWRSQVAQDIAEKYGQGWSFVYSTGMSMADSVTLIGLSAATGGVATPALSAGIMGSRAYVSTLNDALDRGLSDGAAIGLAFSSAVIETAMESYSVGHLLDLEKKLGSGVREAARTIADNIGDEEIADIVTKGFYITASALSQGFAEGEEEFATEILNYAFDMFCARDLSNYAKSIDNYLSKGYTKEQALKMTMRDFSGQATQAFVGGFASGICFGAFSGTTSTINTSYGISQNMYSDLQGTKAQQFAQALEINNQQLQLLEEAQNNLKNGKVLTPEQVELLQTGTTEMQASNKLKQQSNENLRNIPLSIKTKLNQAIQNKDSSIKQAIEIENKQSTEIENKQSTEFENKQSTEIDNNQLINSPTLIEEISDPKIAQFITAFDKHTEYIKELLGLTDAQIPHFFEFREKIIKYGNLEEIINDFENLTEWEIKNLTENDSPIIIDLLNNQKIIDYITQNMSNKEIVDKYNNVTNPPSLITKAFLDLTDQEIKEISEGKIFNLLNNVSKEIQKQFVDQHIEYYSKNLTSIFYNKLNSDAFFAIFDKCGSFEFLKNNMYNIANLSNEIQIKLFEKYKESIYQGTQNDFIGLVRQINDADYQTQFIKNSPFFKEIINSERFSFLLSSIKSKDFVLELIKNPDAYNKLIKNSIAFGAVVSLLSVEEQQEFKIVAKERILEINNTANDSFAPQEIYNYIKGFNQDIQNELLHDEEIVNSLSIEAILELNNEFNGIYLEKLTEFIKQDFNSKSATLLFIPSIYELMSQEDINRAALALDQIKYRRLAELGNQEAINNVVDKLIENEFRGIYDIDAIDSLYKASDTIRKQKIENNIPISTLTKLVGRNSQFADILIKRLTGENRPDTLTIEILSEISKYKLDIYEKVINCLSDKQKLAAFNYENVVKLGLEQKFIDIFRENPILINYMDTPFEFVKILTDKEDFTAYYNNLLFDKIINKSWSKDIENLNKEEVKRIIKDKLSTYTFENRIINNNMIYDPAYTGIVRIISRFSLEEQMEVLNSMKPGDRYFLLMSGTINSKEIKIELIKQMINDPDFRKSIDTSNIRFFNDFFDNLEVENLNYILNNANNHFLGFLLATAKRNDLNVKFKEMIKDNILILNDYEYTDAELIHENLSEENRLLLDEKVNNIISNINNPKILDLLSDATIAQKSIFIGAYNNGLINDEKLDLLITLKAKNKFVLSTFNYQLFDDTIYKFGEKLITKLSKYYDVVNQIVELKNEPQKFKLFSNIIINDTTESAVVADQKMALLLNYLSKNDINPELFNAKTLEEIEIARNIILKEIDQFAIINNKNQIIDRNRNIITPDNYTLNNYYTKLGEKCDELFKTATTIEEVQNLLFNKLYSISIEDAKELFRIYGTRFAEIKNLDNNGIATTYLENIQNILNMSTMEEIKEYYQSYNEVGRYNMDEELNIINEIKKIYTKSLKQTLFNPTEITGYVTYEGKQIPVYQPTGDFQMLIQSTHTNYGGMPIINKSYYDSWNLSNRTQNHGICCSLISNNNMGMALVTGEGIVIGFNSFSDEQMNMMAPYDIYTRNDGYVIQCQRPILYLPGAEVMNETRHTHNEFNLERTNLTGEGNFANIQPDYVLVFDEMSQSLKNNAYKASIEFNIPLVYINKSTIAMQESTKIDNLISEFKKTGNIELLKEILTLHENNRSGFRVSNPELVQQYFPTEKIQTLFEETLLHINDKNNLLYIKDFLEEELRKFDVTYEATNRINEVDINIKDFITEIDKKIQSIQLAGIEFEVKVSADEDATAQFISINTLIDLVKDNNKAQSLITDNNTELLDRSFSKEEYYQAIIQFMHAIKNNNYNLGFTEQEQQRLDSLYNIALNTLDVSAIKYDSLLPDDIKMSKIINSRKIFEPSNLKILFDYFNKRFDSSILDNHPELIFSNEFRFFMETIGPYVFENSSILPETYKENWNQMIDIQKDTLNRIIDNKIDVGVYGFNQIISGINTWHQNEIDYVEYFSKIHDMDISNIQYNPTQPDSIKMKIMIRDGIIYDRNLAIEKFNNNNYILESIKNNNLSVIFDDLFQFYYNIVSETLTEEEMKQFYSHADLQSKVQIPMLKRILNENIDLLKDDFIKFIPMINTDNSIVQEYITNYLNNHPNIDLTNIINLLTYKNDLPVSIKNQFMQYINNNFDSFIEQNSNNIYLVNQNIMENHIGMLCSNIEWLDMNFVNYLVNKRGYKEADAMSFYKSINDEFVKNGKVYINSQLKRNAILEYIYDRLLEENRFDIIDEYNKYFSFKGDKEATRLIKKLGSQGIMTPYDAFRILCAIDSTGVCSYASAVSSIMLAYKNNPKSFEKDFGYPMFIEINGEKEFNSNELLLDMYIYLNSNKYDSGKEIGNLFVYDENGNLKINELNTEKQLFLSGSTFEDLRAINNFLKSKNPNLLQNFTNYSTSYNETGNQIANQNTINQIKERIINHLLKNGNSVKIGISRTKGKEFNFIDKNGNTYRTTNDWNEGDGHAVTLTGIFDDYFIVNSWGIKTYIPIQDFIENRFNIVFRSLEGIR